MKKIMKRIIAAICVICMLMTNEARPCLIVLADMINELPKVLAKSVLTADWDIYRIKVTYGNEDGIPDDAGLVVSEITENNNPYYADYVAASALTVGTAKESINLFRAFDISLCSKASGEEYKPLNDLKVEITIPFYTLKEEMQVEVVHFDEASGDSLGDSGEILTDAGSMADEESQNKALGADGMNGADDGAGVSDGTADGHSAAENSEVPAADALPAAEGLTDIDYSVIGTPTRMETELRGSTASFSTDGFSVFAVMAYTAETWYRDCEGETWRITAVYDAETGIPAGAELLVEELTEADETYAGYVEKTAEILGKESGHFSFARAFDIKLVDPETGEKYRPDKNVKVSIRLLTEDVADGDQVSVVHFEEEAFGVEDNSAIEVMDAAVVDGSVQFTTGSFSVYVISQDVLLRTYCFMNGTDVFNKQLLATGETLTRPADPIKTGAVFSHWAVSEGGAEAVDFDNYPINIINEDTVKAETASYKGIAEADVRNKDMQEYLDANPVTFYAVYGGSYVTVIFYDQEGAILEKKELKRVSDDLSEKMLNTGEVSYIPAQDNEGAFAIFRSWSVTSGIGSVLKKVSGNGTVEIDYDKAQPEDYGTITVDDGTPDVVQLFPELEYGHNIHFNVNQTVLGNTQATFTPSVFVADTDTISEVLSKVQANGAPSCVGYTFDGWYLSSRQAAGEEAKDVVFAYDNDTKTFSMGEKDVNLPGEEGYYYDDLCVDGKLTYNPTLYAHWTPVSQAKYTIVVMKQNLDSTGKQASDEYTYQESYTGTAATGSTISVPSSYESLADMYINTNDYYGFHYNSERSDHSAVVQPDGSTVLMVYYDRNMHTIRFYGGISSSYGDSYGANLQSLFKSGSYYYCYTYSKDGSSYYYTGPLYVKNGASYALATSYNSGGTYYGRIVEEMRPLTRSSYTGTGYNISLKGLLKTLTAPYGARIMDEFSFGANVGISWQPMNKEGYEVQLMAGQTMPNCDVDFYSKGQSLGKYMYYCVEASGAPDEEGKDTREYEGSTFVVMDKIEHGYSVLYYHTDFTPIAGYDNDPMHAAPPFSSGEKVNLGNGEDGYFYYYRHEYHVMYFDAINPDNPELKDTRSILFKGTLAQPSLEVQQAIEGEIRDAADNGRTDPHSGYVFNGWYRDNQLSTRVFFEDNAEYRAYGGKKELLERMPAYELVLYAGWEEITYPVTYFPNLGEMDDNHPALIEVIQNSNAPSYGDITRDYIPAPIGTTQERYKYNELTHVYEQDDGGTFISKEGAYVLIGWFLADESGQIISSIPYDFENRVTGPLYLSARWRRAGGFKVRYDAGADVEAPVDEEDYIAGSHAVVLPSVDAPEGKTLDYWENNGSHYRPNNLIEVDEANAAMTAKGDMEVVLTAVYRDMDPNERFVADYIFKVPGAGYTDDIYDIQTLAAGETLVAPMDPGINGHKFMGWYIDSEGNVPFKAFGAIKSPTTTTIYGVFKKAYTVTYYLTQPAASLSNGITDTVLATQIYGEGEKLDTRHVINPVDVDHYAAAWEEVPKDGSTAAPRTFAYNSVADSYVTENLELYAVLKELQYLHFDSCGGSYVDSVIIPENERPAKPAEPTRSGYFFMGWFTQRYGEGTEYKFDKKLTSAVPEWTASGGEKTLYAHWLSDSDHPASTAVTVVWWVQNSERPDDDGAAAADKKSYQILYHERMTNVTAGAYSKDNYVSGGILPDGWNDIARVAKRGWDNNEASTVSFVKNIFGESPTESDMNTLGNYYEYRSDWPSCIDESIEIDDSGRTVLNVRFALKTYWFRFNTNMSSTDRAAIYDKNGNTYSGSEYEFKVWINRDISTFWPTERPADARDGKTYLVMKSGYRYGGWYERVKSGTGWKNGTGWTVSCQEATKDIFDRGIANIREENGKQYYLFDIISTTSSASSTLVPIIYKWRYPDASDDTFVELPEYRDYVTYDDSKYHSESSNTGSARHMNSRCYVPWYQIRARDIEGYTMITDLNNESAVSGRLHNPYATTNYGSQTETNTTVFVHADKSNSSTVNVTVPLYKYEITDSWKRYEFFKTYVPAHDLFPASLDDELSLRNIMYGNPNDQGYSKSPTWELYSGTEIIHEDYEGRIYYWEGIRIMSMSMDYFVSNVLEKKSMNGTEQIVTGTTLNFYFTPKSYSLTLMLDNTGSGSEIFKSEGGIYYGTKLTGAGGKLMTSEYIPTASNVPQGFTMPAGYRFIGWSSAPGMSSEGDVYQINEGRMPAGNLVLYAVWEPIKYTVTTVTVDDNNDGNDDYYTATSGQRLKELKIKDPKQSGSIFEGWRLGADDGIRISNEYAVNDNIDIYPEWFTPVTRKIVYDANGGQLKSGQGMNIPSDSNKYIIGSRAVIQDGSVLVCSKQDLDSSAYDATFAYWSDQADGRGRRFYPNVNYTLLDSDVNNGSTDTLTLYAVYAEYRETLLIYDLNTADAAAKFVKSSDSSDYTAGSQVILKFRDQTDNRTGKQEGSAGVPNTMITIGTNPSDGVAFVPQWDESHPFFGWSSDKNSTSPDIRNGDRAYVNTLLEKDAQNQDVLRNTLYAIYGICKVVDKNGKEHIFGTIQKAVDFISSSSLIENRLGIVQMLVDYKMGSSYTVSIPSGCTVTLTTAKPLSEQSASDGVMYYYNDSSHTSSEGDVRQAIIIRSESGGSMFTNAGSFTTTQIIIDGGFRLEPSKGCTGNGGIIKGNSGTVTVGEDTLLRRSKASNGGAVYLAEGAAFTLDGGKIEDCSASGNGGGIYSNGTVTLDEKSGDDGMMRGTIENCTAKNGGGIYVNNGMLTLHGGGIEYCTAVKAVGDDSNDSGNGGGLYMDNNSRLILTGTSAQPAIIDHCTAQNNGGGFYVTGTSEMTINGGHIEDCSAVENGGAIYDHTAGRLEMGNITIIGHTVGGLDSNTLNAKKGGCIYVDDGELHLTDSEIYDFTAEQGGAIYHIYDRHKHEEGKPDGMQLFLTNVKLDGHVNLPQTASDVVHNAEKGGVVYLYNGCNTELPGHSDKCVDKDNKKLSQKPGPKLVIDGGSEIKDCTASKDGGIVYCDSPANNRFYTVTIQKTTIIGHDSLDPGVYNAGDRGGAVYEHRGFLLVGGSPENRVTITRCTAPLGGAIFNMGNASYTGETEMANTDDSYASYTIKVTDSEISGGGMVNAADGGGIYLKMGGALLADCTLTDLEVSNKGAAVFARTNDGGTLQGRIAIVGGVITGCRAGGADGGAINAANTVNDKSVCTVSFSNEPVVYGNYNTKYDTAVQHNVVLEKHTSETIRTSSKGLGENALIGVYVTGDDSSEPYMSHGAHLDDFGTWGNSDNLRRFINDRNGMYGEVCSVASHNHGNAKIMHWQNYLCKLTVSDKDAGGNPVNRGTEESPLYLDGRLLYKDAARTLPAVYDYLTDQPGHDADPLLKGGFNESQAGTLYDENGAVYTGGVKVEMLKNYDQPDSDRPTVSASKPIELVTSKTFNTQNPAYPQDVFIYVANATDEIAAAQVDASRATIIRKESGGSMFAVNGTDADMTVRGIIFDGNKARCQSAENGGVVNVYAGQLKLLSGTVLQNSISANGGAVFVTTGAVLDLANGSAAANGARISGNESSGDGAGIYLEQGSKLHISGNPDFGDGNFRQGTLADKTNGGTAYDRARQDIYFVGYYGIDTNGDPIMAASIKVNGRITSGDGTIWVWASQPEASASDEEKDNNHYEQLKQFGMFSQDGVFLSNVDKKTSMKAFRNAVSDDLTGAGEPLYGEFSEDDSSDVKINIHWSGVRGYRKVMIRKISRMFEPLSGAKFSFYRGSSMTPYVAKDKLVGTQVELKDITSKESGILWIGTLPYGTYYIKETQAPDKKGYGGNVGKWYCLIVDEKGVFMSADGYKNGEDDAANKALALANAQSLQAAAASGT